MRAIYHARDPLYLMLTAIALVAASSLAAHETVQVSTVHQGRHHGGTSHHGGVHHSTGGLGQVTSFINTATAVHNFNKAIEQMAKNPLDNRNRLQLQDVTKKLNGRINELNNDMENGSLQDVDPAKVTQSLSQVVDPDAAKGEPSATSERASSVAKQERSLMNNDELPITVNQNIVLSSPGASDLSVRSSGDVNDGVSPLPAIADHPDEEGKPANELARPGGPRIVVQPLASPALSHLGLQNLREDITLGTEVDESGVQMAARVREQDKIGSAGAASLAEDTAVEGKRSLDGQELATASLAMDETIPLAGPASDHLRGPELQKKSAASGVKVASKPVSKKPWLFSFRSKFFPSRAVRLEPHHLATANEDIVEEEASWGQTLWTGLLLVNMAFFGLKALPLLRRRPRHPQLPPAQETIERRRITIIS